ncbi:MAG: hypothetical protein GY874_15005 [Desulfobacteraceae bacterium]|nr:hypothetical protein [Desulfobacteraceae bacterium]
MSTLAPPVGTDVVDDCDMVCIMDDVVDDDDKLVVAPMADDEVKDLMPRGRQKGQKFSAPVVSPPQTKIYCSSGRYCGYLLEASF